MAEQIFVLTTMSGSKKGVSATCVSAYLPGFFREVPRSSQPALG
jgi:hypothetical protein